MSDERARWPVRQLAIEKLVPGGRGLARDDDGVVFVAGVAAGDVVDVEIAGRAGGARRASVLRLVQPSPDRQDLDCPVGDRCGGCDWLHLTPQARATWKQALAADSLRRIGRFPDDVIAAVLQPLRSPPDERRLWGRRRVRVVVGRHHEATYAEQGSHVRVPTGACAALHPRLADVVDRLVEARLPVGVEVRLAVDDADTVVAAVIHRGAAERLHRTGLVAGVVVPRVEGSAWGADNAAAFGDVVVRGEISAGRFAALSDAATFSQATRHGGAAIVDAVLDAVVDGLAGVDDGAVLELFAGAGHLTLPLAQGGRRVIAVEADGRAVSYLKQNAALVPGPIEAHVRFVDGAFAAADVNAVDAVAVVIDPPRAGVIDGAKVFAALPGHTLVMVSCDPATGARDLRLAQAAGYRLTRVVTIDAFPRTHHLEWVATLKRVG